MLASPFECVGEVFLYLRKMVQLAKKERKTQHFSEVIGPFWKKKNKQNHHALHDKK